MKNRVMERDLPNIRESLRDFESYSFSADLDRRMKEQSLSSVTMGMRAGVSHAIVNKWLKNQARPNGKERMKELGMGLGMDVEELNRFLYRNGYPRLYVKNPLDSVAIQLLQRAQGREDIVSMYRELLEISQLNRFSPAPDANDLRTSVMLSGLLERDGERLEEWISENRPHFVADAKTALPDVHMAEFLRLYVGDESANSLYETAELPSLLVPVLTAVLNGKSVTVRGLREKLIALGLYLNLTEEEIDVLLEFVRLRPLTDPASRLEQAVLLSVREAHEQYALYESENLEKALKWLSASDKPYEQVLLPDYSYRFNIVNDLASYYLRSKLSDEDMEFRERYSSYGDKGLMDYVFDVLSGLAESGDLEKTEVEDFLENIRRNEEGEE